MCSFHYCVLKKHSKGVVTRSGGETALRIRKVREKLGIFFWGVWGDGGGWVGGWREVVLCGTVHRAEMSFTCHIHQINCLQQQQQQQQQQNQVASKRALSTYKILGDTYSHIV